MDQPGILYSDQTWNVFVPVEVKEEEATVVVVVAAAAAAVVVVDYRQHGRTLPHTQRECHQSFCSFRSSSESRPHSCLERSRAEEAAMPAQRR